MTNIIFVLSFVILILLIDNLLLRMEIGDKERFDWMWYGKPKKKAKKK